MGLIPIKRQQPMTSHTEMTREELNAFRAHKQKIEYNQAEAMDLLNLVRKYINKNQPSCFSCGNALRDAKNTANQFLMDFGEIIEARLQVQENTIIEESKPITNGKKRKEK